MHITNGLSRVKNLIKEQNINQTDSQGKTLLMKALEEGFSQQEILFLLEQGADVNLTDKRGESVLDKLENKFKKLLSGREYCSSLPCLKKEMIPVMEKMLKADAHLYKHSSVIQVLNYSINKQKIQNEPNPLNLPNICQLNRKELVVGYGELGNALLIPAKDVSLLLENKDSSYRHCFLDRLEKLVNVPISLSQHGSGKPYFVKEFLPIVLNLLEKDEQIDRHSVVNKIVKEQSPQEWRQMICRRINLSTPVSYSKSRYQNNAWNDVPSNIVIGAVYFPLEKIKSTQKQRSS